MLNFLKLIFNPDLFTFYFGGGSSPTQNTSYNTNIPEYAEPYVKTMLGATEKQLYKYGPNGKITGFQPFQSYGDYDRARGGTGETVAGFTPMQTKSMRGIQNYQLPEQTGYASQMAGSAGLGSMMAGQNYQQMATDPSAIQAYMSPYAEAALQPQLREAARQSAIQGQQNQAQAVQQGAFGGSRSALVEAERQRNLGQLQGDIYGKGMQDAFQNAQQAQQFGSKLGLEGYGQGLQAASQLGSLGQQQYGQEMGLMGKQMEIGGQQQQYEQSRLNQIIQDYATSQQYPLMQLGVLSNMLRGLPMQAATTQMYQAQPSMMSQMAGGLGTGMALYNQYNQMQQGQGKAEGGYISDEGVKKYAKGGITGEFAVSDIVSKLSDAQLDAQLKNPNSTPEVKEAAAKETQRRAELRGMAGGGVVAFAGKDKSLVEDEFNTAITEGRQEAKDKKAAREAETKQALSNALNNQDLSTPFDRPRDVPPMTDMKAAALRESVRGAMRNPDLSTPFDKPRGVTTMADMEAAAKQGFKPNTPISTDNAVNRGILSAIQKQPVSGAVQGENTAPTEEPVVSERNLGDSGLSDKPKGILTGPPKVEGEAAPAPIAEIKAPAPTDAESELAAYAAQQKIIKDRTAEAQAELTREERKKLGIVNPSASEAEKLEAKKRKIEAGAKDEYMDRLAEFLMTWGSLPGPTLVAANQAGRMFIANSIADKKERKRLLDGIDASLADINKGVYLEKLGEHKDAEAKIEAAGKRFFEVNEKLRESGVKKAELQNATARTLATLASEEARARAKNLLDERLKSMEVNKATDFMNQVQIRTKAMIAKGAPADENTLNKAMTEIIEETKGLDAKMLSAMASTNQATAALANATTNQQNVDVRGREADTQRERARVEARKSFRSDLLTTMMKTENEAAISAARKKDKDAGINVTDPNSQERKVRSGIESDLLATPAYKGLLTPEDVGIAPAPAPKKDAAAAAPNKDAAPAKPSISDVNGAPKGSSVGNFVQGKGWEIKGSDGKLIGYSK